MAISHFPPLDTASPEGLIGVGGDLEIESLLLAYRNGIFPWPHDDSPLLWFTPPMRAVLDFHEFHISRSLRKFRRRSTYKTTINQAFTDVIHACSSAYRPTQDGTWITNEMVQAYIRMHQHGHAMSVETWDAGELVGGLYGVRIDKMFCGESMFFRSKNASKIALIRLVEQLQSDGLSWIDVQVMTPLFESFGAKEIPRDVFVGRLASATQT